MTGQPATAGNTDSVLPAVRVPAGTPVAIAKLIPNIKSRLELFERFTALHDGPAVDALKQLVANAVALAAESAAVPRP